MNDEEWLHDRLADAVPPPPTAPDRMAGIAALHQRRQRRVAAAAAAAICVTVAGAAVSGRALMGDGSASGPTTAGPTESTSQTEPAISAIECPKDLYSGDSGKGVLEPGVVAVRLCSSGGLDSEAPADTLTTGLDQLVDTINTAEPAHPGCLGGMGGDYVLLAAYGDGSVRRVALRLACDYLHLGSRLLSAHETFDQFARLIRQQRASSTPPTTAWEPMCVPDRIYSAFAGAGEMVVARMCVSYANDGFATMSVPVAAEDLAVILDGWRDAPGTPIVKGPPCSPTTPDWILSGVTQWGDRVAIEAECDRPSRGQDWVRLPPRAREVVDELIEQVGVHVRDGSDAEVAWVLADHWIDAVNARAIMSHHTSAAAIGRVANAMWVADPWLPDGELDWQLLAASEIDVPGWQFAWRVPARTPAGQAVFTIVRDSKDEPWRILSLDR